MVDKVALEYDFFQALSTLVFPSVPFHQMLYTQILFTYQQHYVTSAGDSTVK
jgi:hypothetical protein